MLLELNKQDRLLAMRRHQLALGVPVRDHHHAAEGRRLSTRSQSAAVEARHKVRYAPSFYTQVRRQDVVPDSERNRQNKQPRGMQQ